MRQLAQSLRIKTGAAIVDSFFRYGAAATRLHPRARPERHDVELLPDLPYVDDGIREHLLDVWRPERVRRPMPIVFYLHGGGFRILSKDTHWMMALSFAKRGYLVFAINYRLAPAHPFPAAISDACAAYTWIARNAPRYGGDLGRLVVAGESAGANLATALTVAACWRRDEPWARAVWETGVVPRAVMPACGMLQVSDAARFARRKKHLPIVIADRIAEVELAYLGGAHATPSRAFELADPLLVLERGEPPQRALPPFHAVVGTKDPLLDDTRRLKRAVERLGGVCEARYYVGEPHAFHALVIRRNARRCWKESFDFLSRALAEPESTSDRSVRQRG
jgi:acetyl esterase